MKKIFILILICLMVYIMGYATTTTTTNLLLVKPAAGDETVDFFDTVNSNMDLIDAAFNDVLKFDTTPVLKGNLDISTFNIEGVDATEFGYIDGITSAIQTQLNAKQPLDAQLTDIAGLTPTDSYFIVGDGVNFITESGATARTSLGINLSLYYLKTEIDTQGEMETIWAVSLENETHASEHAVSGADTIFPADPNADKYLMWDDVPGELVWAVGGGASTFVALTDTPANYAGQAGLFAKVNVGETALEFASGAGGDTLPVVDTTGIAKGSVDATKIVRFEVDGLTTGTTRVLTVPDKDITIADNADLHTQNTDTDLDATFEATFAKKADKLSVFAATTSAELAGVISDEIGSGKLRFDTSVTAKTTTATLNVNEAGTILCSAAGGAYTITLPTAVGNTGLTYHFIKTDANYTLITLDGDGTETFNYENSTGAPVLTYARLNTYCAEVTIVSDGTNWQVIDEALGQVPRICIQSTADILNIVNGGWHFIPLDSKIYDVGSNYNISQWISGAATATSANHLVDTTNNQFTAAMVGYRIKNTTDTTYAWITAYNSVSDVTVSVDIFVNTEGYQIMNSKFVVPVPGIYFISASLTYDSVIAAKRYISGVHKNGTNIRAKAEHSSIAEFIYPNVIVQEPLAKNDYIQLTGLQLSGANTVDIQGGVATYIQIRLVSKD